MTFQLHRSEKSRHFVLRVSAGESLPEALTGALRAEQVMCGWLRASGVLADVELRAFSAERGTLGATRRIAGPVQLLSLEGGTGLGEQGEPTVSLRAVLARETESGLETLSGEIASARAVAVEAIVTVLEDLALERTLDPAAGVFLFSATPTPDAPGRAAAPPSGPAVTQPTWSAAVDASVEATREPAPARPRAPNASAPLAATTVPQRPARPPGAAVLDAPVPEAGDVVEHFAFGSCDVIKSDGDRLHLRVGKEGRVREIALEMLRVTRLDDVAGKQHFKLERRL